MKPQLTRHPHGITAVDAEYVRPLHAAIHIIEHRGRAAIVDTGTTHSVPYTLAALSELGLSPADVDFVLLTHVHLDHAGGAGALMQALPNARAVLHPRGAPHMISPEKLIAGSMAVYGEERYRALYGEIVPIPKERVLTTEDGQQLNLAGRTFRVLHTPGHALHHHCFFDEQYRNVFTGDTFGLSYRELDNANGAFVMPTTTPTQFDPDQLIASIDRIVALGPEAVYLTHYSRVTDVPRLAESLKLQIRAFVEIAQRSATVPDPKEAIRREMAALWQRMLRERGSDLSPEEFNDLLGNDLELNSQGLIAWLERLRR